MQTVSGPGAKPPKPSGAMPPWIGYVGLAMFVPGCLAAAWGIRAPDMKLGLSGAVLLSLGVQAMANAYTASVRADLLRRIEDLEWRARGGPDAEPVYGSNCQVGVEEAGRRLRSLDEG